MNTLVTRLRKTFAPIALLCAIAATGSAQTVLSIKPLSYFGDDAGSPARGTLPADAGMLASVGLVRELGNRSIAVYDPKAKRIVVFDSAGKVVRHIGRMGKGPGEFTNVLSMDYDAGRLAVYDYSLLRITLFDTTGRILKSVPTGSANHIVLRGDSIWGAKRGATKLALWAQSLNDPTGERVEVLPFETPNPGFNAPNSGSYFLIARDNDGATLIAHDIPGLWYTANKNGISGILGRELFPGARYFVSNGIPTSPGQVDGMIGLGPNWVGMLVLTMDKDRKQGDPLAPRRLAVFQRNGQFVSFVTFPETPGRSLATSARPREFYYVSSEPYYRIVRATIVETRK